MLKVTH